MVDCTDTGRGTTLPSCARRAQLVELVAPRRGWLPTPVTPVVGSFQGGAIAASGKAAVNDLMVTDHQYSTRLGPSSCSPPV